VIVFLVIFPRLSTTKRVGKRGEGANPLDVLRLIYNPPAGTIDRCGVNLLPNPPPFFFKCLLALVESSPRTDRTRYLPDSPQCCRPRVSFRSSVHLY